MALALKTCSQTAFKGLPVRQPCSRRALICRAETATTTTAPATSSVDAQDEKIRKTLSSLDALVPTPPKPSTSQASTSSSASSAAKPAQQPAQQPSFSLPAFGGDAKKAAPASPAARKAQIGFEQVMGFSGFAPEVINGRAAMLGFLAAITSELGNGESVFAQLVSGGLAEAGAVILFVIVASFAPALRGVPMDKVFGKDKTPAAWGPFNVNAELINGRAAMLGLALVLFFEGGSSSAFFL